MKHIATVNCQLPSIEDNIHYDSGQSLLDYDIVLFDPCFPCFDRVHFSSGGSCISIEGAKAIMQSLAHWRKEIMEALKVGKTIYFLLNRYQADWVATGTTSPRKGETNYSTAQINNYSVLPAEVSVRNAKGKRFKAQDANFKQIYDALKDFVEYQVVITSKVSKQTFIASGDNVVGAWIKLQDHLGHLVLLPYFDLSEMTEIANDVEVWTDDALRVSNILVSQMLAIDSALNDRAKSTPKPD